MKLQGRNLTNGTQGEDVRLLHHELLLLGFRIIPDIELHPGIFGPFTLAVVRDFQKNAGLPVTGVVDEPTAHAINERVDRINQRQPPVGGAPLAPDRTVGGQVRHADGSAFAAVLVRAFHQAVPAPVTLGEAATDAGGQYAIGYNAPDVARVILRVAAFDAAGKELQSSPVIPDARPQEVVDLVLPGATQPGLRIFGVVRGETGDPLDGLTVLAADRDLRREESLGSTVTANGGRYEIRYVAAQFARAEKLSADVVVTLRDADGKERHKTPIHFNVPDDFELNITLGGTAYQGASEWDVMNAELTTLLDGLSPLDLREDDTFQDLTFLVGETGRDRLHLVAWIFSYRLADKTVREQTPLAAEAVFAFLRQGQPSVFRDTLLQDLAHPDRVTLLEDSLLRGLAAITPELQQALLEKAISSNIVSLRIKPQIPSILETLKKINTHYAAKTSFGGGKGTIGQLLELNPAAKAAQTAVMEVFVAHTGPLSTFWKTLSDQKVLPPEAVTEVKLSFELGALTRNHVPLVDELVTRFRTGGLKEKRQLAAFSQTDWIDVFNKTGPDGKPVGVPDNIDGDTPDKKKEQYAAILEQQFERAYPTASFGAKLNRSAQPPITAKSDVVRFLDNNPAFQLDRVRFDHYVDEHAGALQGIENPVRLRADLQSAQRVFKLNPTYKAVDALLARKIDSAQQIYFMGQTQFLKTMEASDVNRIEARTLYRRAENAYAQVLTLFGDYNLNLNGALPFAVPQQTPDAATRARLTVLPNVQTLFGSLDYCECTYCRSVYSPAAYFVDVMRFLGQRKTQGNDINRNKNVRQVLFERRPDLGEIELSCENTNTPLPYIDLVNEILEDVVAPPAPFVPAAGIEASLLPGTIKKSVLDELTKFVPLAADAQVYEPDSRQQWAVRDGQHAYRIFKSGAQLQLLPTRQTFSSAAELRANPEYTNASAYETLKGEIFPLTLPFDLWSLQTRTYLDHLGVPQPRLFELFQQKLADGVTLSPTDLLIDCAWLRITNTERAILTGSLAGKKTWEFWGLAENANDIPNPENPADPGENAKGTWIEVLGHVNVMLHRSGLAYKELLQLLDMKYVNPDGTIFIFDTPDSNAANCDTSKFTIRNLAEGALDRAHRFIRLWRKLGCAMWELDILIGSQITDTVLQNLSRMSLLRDETGLEWRILHSLYNGIDDHAYVDRTTDGAPVQTLYQRLFRNKLVDAVAGFPDTPAGLGGAIADRVPGILAAFRIKEDDLRLILDDLSLTPTSALNADVLGRIYRIAVLAQATGLTVDQFLRLKRLSGEDPFADPAATRRFLELAKQVASSTFSVIELDYLLAHSFTPNSGVALEDKTIVLVAGVLREGLLKISDDIRRKPEETKESYVRRKLGLLNALAKDADQTIALAIIDGTWPGTDTAKRNTFIDAFFTGVLDPTEAKAHLAALAPGLTPAERQTEVDARFDYVQGPLESFLLRTLKETFLY